MSIVFAKDENSLKGLTRLAVIVALLILTPGVAYAAVTTSDVPISDGFDYPVGIPTGDGYRHGQTIGGNDGWDFLEDEGSVLHPGEDWNGNGGGDSDLGDPVYAVSNGRIIAATNYGSGWGNIILIEHRLQDGTIVWSNYAHLRDINVVSGNVQRGQQIGTIGKGYNNEYNAHLHFEIRKNNLAPDAWVTGQDKTQIFTNYYDPSDFISSHRPKITTETFDPNTFKIKQEWLFDVTGDIDGWEPHNVEGVKYSVEGGRLFFDPAGSNPWIEKNGLSIDASTAKYVNFEMSSNCPDNIGTVYFTTAESPVYGEDKKVGFTATTGPAWYDYSVSMAQNPLWKGAVTGIRINPANNGIANTNEDTVGFEYIKVE
ncbi:Phage protein [Methanosarcina lacustris Z-7289]|uniref:Phage protein n=1 Tax=Methanosarcina lacustris Z-7289 TaxID=1434111 RepID=A0A0E3WRJ3_9EURY|nr:M23 family metallopeptidase [Methanosarcina lacustris]AKB75160.1 Phage protein [Methanosarcina lacustris Z-7289]